MTGSFGAGAILWAPAATAFSELFGFLKAFAALGVLLFGIMLIFVWFIRDVPKDLNIPQKISHRNNLTSPDLNWKQMLRTKRFYTLVVILAFGTGSGLMIMGHASPMIQSMANLTPEKAALTVGFLAIANTFGRLLWGTLSDRLGRFHVLFILFAGMATLSGLLTFAAGSAWIALLLLACTCYGGLTSILSPIAADVFGTKYLNVNYNFFFMAYGIGGILGPQLAAICVDSGFGYNPAFLVMTLLLLIGAGVTFCCFILPNRKLARRDTY